jgi:prevent-host-death family protein
MHSVGIKALKNRLSEYVRAAAAGEPVLVTDRGRVVAELIAPRARAHASPTKQRWAELVRRGLVTPAKKALRGPPPRVAAARLDELMRELHADREDR